MFNKYNKKDYKALQNAIIDELVKDDDGSQVMDPDYFHQTCSIEFGIDGKPKKLKYEPEKYNKAKKVTKQTNVETYTNKPQQKRNRETYEDLYLDHLAGDVTASYEIGADPYYKE